MRKAIYLLFLLAASCGREPDFDQRYADTERQLVEKTAEMDRQLSAASTDAAQAERPDENRAN